MAAKVFEPPAQVEDTDQDDACDGDALFEPEADALDYSELVIRRLELEVEVRQLDARIRAHPDSTG